MTRHTPNADRRTRLLSIIVAQQSCVSLIRLEILASPESQTDEAKHLEQAASPRVEIRNLLDGKPLVAQHALLEGVVDALDPCGAVAGGKDELGVRVRLYEIFEEEGGNGEENL